MSVRPNNPADGEQRLYEQLAELLDTRDRTGRGDTATVPLHEPDVAAGVRAYFAAADVVNRFAGGLMTRTPRRAPLPVPSQLGDYELLAEIGRGGAAVVYRARQAGLNRLVAIKMLHGGRTGSLHDVERLRFEAEAVAQLEHSGIVPIYEIGEHEGRPYFSMQLYDEGSLSGRLQQFVSQPRRAAELVEAVAQAVQHAHERGILHRDLKPSNILLDAGGRPHVADFGLAKRLIGNTDLTHTGELIGTPAYMPPERVAGSTWAGPTTIASDVYGLGAILYVLLTGRAPFEGETPVETLLAVGTTDVTAPSALNAAVERDLETICLKCLEKAPASRYTTAADVATDLRRWLQGEPINARQTSGAERVKRWCRRHPVRTMAVLAAAVMLIVSGIGLATGYIVVNRAYQAAENHRATAETHAAQLDRQLYVSQMSLGHRRMERGELVELQSILDEYRERPEMQGFEWHWLSRRAQGMPPQAARFIGHEHIVYGGAFSPHGDVAATCGADGKVRLWDPSTGVEQRVLNNGAGMSPAGVPYDENAVVFSPDGTHLVSVGEDGGVRLWKLADGTMSVLTPQRLAEALCVDISPDGARVTAAWTDGFVHVWDVASRGMLFQQQVGQQPIHGVRFVRDANQLVTLERGGTVSTWDVSSGAVVHSRTVPGDARCLGVSSSGNLIATAGNFDDRVVIWNAIRNAQVHDLPAGEYARSLSFSPDEQRIAVTGNDGCIRIWSLRDGSLETYFRASSNALWTVAFAPDGRRVLAVSGDMAACIWDVSARPQNGTSAGRLPPLRHLAWSPDNQHLAVTTEQAIVLYCRLDDLQNPQPLPEVLRTFRRPVFLRGGRELAVVTIEGLIRRWDVESNVPLPEENALPPAAGGNPLVDRFEQIAVLGGDKLVATTSRQELLILEHDGWQPVEKPVRSESVYVMGTLADQSGLIVRRAAPTRIESWAVDQGRVRVQPLFPAAAAIFADSPSGERRAFGQSDGTIELIDSSTGVHRILLGHTGPILSLGFSADGRTLASGSQDRTARLWNVATGTELFVIDRGSKSLHAIEFSPDGRMLAVAGDPREDSAATLTIFRIDD